MFNVADNERQHLISLISEQGLVQHIIESTERKYGPREWDGYIHASALDWNQDPQKQFERLINKTNFSSTYTAAGDIYHESIQNRFKTFFGSENTYIEYKIQHPQLAFQGSPDYIKLGSPIGNVLMEFKTTSEFARDKSGADRMMQKLMNNNIKLQYKDTNITLGDLFIIEPKLSGLLDEISTRMRITQRKVEPKSNHLTQLFTYVWAMSGWVQFDWVCLAYICRESFATRPDKQKPGYEFWFYIPNHQEKIQRAAVNFYEVQRCLIQHQQNTLTTPYSM